MNHNGYDKETEKWFENHPDAQTTTMQCDKCGLSYKPSLGHKCKYALKKAEKILPCPFCGAHYSDTAMIGCVNIYQSPKTGCFQVHCYKCNTTSDWYDTEAKARRKWNKRALPVN